MAETPKFDIEFMRNKYLMLLRCFGVNAHTYGESSSHCVSASLAALEFSSRNSFRCSFVLHSLPWRFFESPGNGGSTPSISTQGRSVHTSSHHILMGSRAATCVSASLAALEFSSRNSFRCSFVLHSLRVRLPPSPPKN